MARKKRRKIASLLELYSRRKERVHVLIKGSASGQILFEGPLWYTPFLLTSDFVLDYKYADGLLEIVSTCNPFYGD